MSAAPALLRAALADPQYLAEHLAVLAVTEEGPKARALVGRLRGAKPEADEEELLREAITRGVRLTVIEGSAVGGPFIVLVPVAFCAALLSQVRMVMALATVAGRGSDIGERAAELLVLQGVYPDVAQAAVGLAAAGKVPGRALEGRLPRGTRRAMVHRMAYLLGLLEPEPEQHGRLRQLAGWLGVAAVVAVGLLLPLVWIPAMGVAYQRATTRLGRRAADYYLPTPEGRARQAALGRARWSPSPVLVFVRTVVAVLLPALALAVVVAADLRVAGSKATAGAVAVVAVSVAVATVHGVRHWHLRRQG